MLTFDLVLLRILFTGIVSSLLLLIFWLLRRFCTPVSRRIIWLTMIICALFIIPIPLIIKLPATWPDWIFNWRLPDPTQLILSRDSISRIFQHFLTGKGTAAVPIGYLLENRGFLPALTLGDWLIEHLPELRMIYLAGLILTIAYLTLKSMQGKKRWQQRVILSDAHIDLEAWQNFIVKIRDEIRIYRQYDPIIADTQMSRPIDVFLNWRHHKILVPMASPDDISEVESRQWLSDQLKKNRLTELLWLAGWLLVRVLIWFSPVWALSSRKLLFDTSRQPGEIHKRSWLFSIFVIALITLLACAGLSWQLSAKIVRDYYYRMQNITLTEDINLLAVKAVDFSQDRSANSYGYYMTMDNNNVLLMNAFNEPCWSSSISDIINLENDQQYIQISYRQLADHSWSFLVGVGARRVYIDKYYRLIFDAQGQILDNQLVWSDQIASIYGSVGSIPEFELTDDGGWLMTIRSWYDADLSSSIYASTEIIRWVVRFDLKGQEVWRLGHEAISRLQGISISMDNGNGIFGSIGFGQTLRLPTSGPSRSTVLLTTDYISLINYYDDSDGIPDSLSNIERNNWSVSLLDASGNLQWRRIIYASDIDMYVNQVFCSDDAVYLLCDVQDRIGNTIIPALIALSIDGDIIWTIQLNDYSEFQWSDFYISDECLTCVLMNYQNDTDWPVKICQFALDGTPIGTAVLLNRLRIIDVETGIIRYAEPREGINP